MISVSWNRWISDERLKQFVYANISFALPEGIWRVINVAFMEIWHDQLLHVKWFHRDDLNDFIYTRLKANRILMPVKQVDEVVTLMLICIDLHRNVGSGFNTWRETFGYRDPGDYEVAKGSE
jgi:hypothetical protein